MPHPIYGAPDHALETISVNLVLPVRGNEHRTSMSCHGRSGTSRPNLWTVSESWSWSEQKAGLQPVDAVAHVLLAALQDRPTSQEQIEACLIGEGWSQLTLDL